MINWAIFVHFFDKIMTAAHGLTCSSHSTAFKPHSSPLRMRFEWRLNGVLTRSSNQRRFVAITSRHICSGPTATTHELQHPVFPEVIWDFGALASLGAWRNHIVSHVDHHVVFHVTKKVFYFCLHWLHKVAQRTLQYEANDPKLSKCVLFWTIFPHPEPLIAPEAFTISWNVFEVECSTIPQVGHVGV